MKATLTKEGNEFVLIGELSDDIGYTPDAELQRSRNKQSVLDWAEANGYTVIDDCD
jgi:hypothetical protein